MRDIRPVIFDVARYSGNVYKLYLLNTRYIRDNYVNVKSIGHLEELKGINIFNDPLPVFYQGNNILIKKSSRQYMCNDSSNKIKGIYTHQYETVAEDGRIKVYIAANKIHVRFLEHKGTEYTGVIYESNDKNILYSSEDGNLEKSDIIFLDGYGNEYPCEFEKVTLEDEDLDNPLEVIHIYNTSSNRYLNLEDCEISLDYDGTGSYISVASERLVDGTTYILLHEKQMTKILFLFFYK